MSGCCYVCDISHSCKIGKTRSFHRISIKLYKRPIADKWLEFLFLPPVNVWPNCDWKNVVLCSIHFQEEDFSGRQMCFRTILKDDAVPTRYPPNGPGRFGALFSQGETIAEIPPPSEEQEEMITESVSYSNQEKSEEEHSDFANLDHDYINIVKVDEQPADGNSVENLNDLQRELMLQDLKKDMCRLCGQMGTPLSPILDSSSTEMNEISVSEKIHMHLPFKVNGDDMLPCHICLDCSVQLNSWHDFYVTCLATDTVLKKTFSGESQMSSQEDGNPSVNRDQVLNELCISDVDLLADAGSHKDSTILNAECETHSLDESKEQMEIICSVCGMYTPTKPEKEENLFISDFGCFYSQFHSTKWKCKFCYEFFHNPKAKKEHCKNCRELSTVCEICGKSVVRKKLVKHQYVKHHFPLCVCDKCGKILKSGYLLKKHINVSHLQDVVPRFCCNLCCTAFAKEEFYVDHQKRHKKGKIKAGFQIKEQPPGEVYICPVCNETFNDALSLVVHLTSKREMKCPSCRKRVRNEKMLLVHVCNKYECRYCSKTYSLKMDWVIHERLHTGEKPMKCRMCDKSFRSYALRRSHERSHTPLHQCLLCNKKFRNKYMYQDHLLWHQGKVFFCSICEKGFGTRRNVASHVQKCHKGRRTRTKVA